MAGACTCHSFCHNPFPKGEDELGPPEAPNKSSNIYTFIPAMSCAPTPIPAPLSPFKNRLFQ